ncbi:pentatricopeptide repeat domain-containing protein [Sarocladium implicatum]|nr:pentatricopeptide repeat domain-containing protein [Sarocladium implicatum]
MNLLPHTCLASQDLSASVSSQHSYHSNLVADVGKWSSGTSSYHSGLISAQESEDSLEDSGTSSKGTGKLGRDVVSRPDIEPEILSDNVSEWYRHAVRTTELFGPEAAWQSMSLLRQADLRLLARRDADLLRDAFLQAAIGDDLRLHEFVQVVKALEECHGFEWADLYGNVMYNLLDEGESGRAVFWHSRLYSTFGPSRTVFAALLSHFVVDSSPDMQSTLVKLYKTSKGAKLYDSIIPRLFDWGQSALARQWRKMFLLADDMPTSPASSPFLRFLSAYYPTLPLKAPERTLIEPSTIQPPPIIKTKSDSELQSIRKLTQGDHLVAKWFASAWTTLDFAIDLAHRIGVTMLGPLALQAMGLRERGATSLSARLSQLENLGVEISPMTYCRVLVYFAKHNEDALLESLLTSDVHPDEFEDVQTVHMLASAAERRQDAVQKRLMVEVERVMQILSAEDVSDEPSILKQDLSMTQTGLSDLDPTQYHAREALDIVFEGIHYHPRKWMKRQPRDGEERLHLAVSVLRQAFADDVPIPLEYWRRTIYSLGRLGQLSLLETVCLDIAQMYNSSQERLIPVHASDVPGQAGQTFEVPDLEEEADGLEMWQRAVESRSTGRQDHAYIPSDLPFSHRQHPIQLIFHQRLQRNILRWGFDNALQNRHPITGPAERQPVTTDLTWRAAQSSKPGLGRGLSILAKLRQAGVLIDRQIIRSELVNRIIAAEFPGRDRAPWMDSHELAIPHLMRLVEGIWGPGVFENAEELKRLVEDRRDKNLNHYWKHRLTSKAQNRHRKHPRN